MKVVGIVQARTTSSRLPGKALLDLAGAPAIVRMLERVKRARKLNAVWVATSDESSDDELAAVVDSWGVPVYRGPLHDVLARFRGAAACAEAQVVVRLTGDCPLHDPAIIDCAVEAFLGADPPNDYMSNTLRPTYPDGLDSEIFTFAALERAHREAKLAPEREHVTPYMYQGKAAPPFRIAHLEAPANFSHLRWTLDHPEDLVFARSVFAALLPHRPDFGWLDVVALLTREPQLLELNSHVGRNEKYCRELEQA